MQDQAEFEKNGRKGRACPREGGPGLESGAAFGSYPEAEEPDTERLQALAVIGEEGGREASEAARLEGTTRGKRRRV